MVVRGWLANTYLEGTYSEVYPDISQDTAGLKKIVHAVFFPEESPVMLLRKLQVLFTKVVS